MKRISVIGLMSVLILSSVYWLATAKASCDVPLSYSIGNFDDRFNITKQEARIAVMEAEAVWENATGKNLFRYDEAAEFEINFVFDERQQLTQAEQNLRERLDASRNVNEAIDSTYSELLENYEQVKQSYQTKVEAYEERLAEYNAEVESYNQSGGAPKEVYEKLEEEKQKLDREQQQINELASRLNQMVDKINELGEQGNELVNKHNENVEAYNETFGKEREFTQGDYQGDHINIYTFSDKEELVLVIAHELGHALSIGHVEDKQAVMYYLMGNQPKPLSLNEADLEAFNQLCGEDTGYGPHYELWRARLLDWLKNWSVL